MLAVDKTPDQQALARWGAQVRKRLDANPDAYKVPNDAAEIYAFGAVLSAPQCAELITLVDAVAEPSRLYDKGALKAGFRTSYSGNVDPSDPLVDSISQMIDKVLGIEERFGEHIQGQRYEVGQEFKPHNDWFYADQPYWPEEERNGGQRSWTAMLYLNDVEAGGGTHFVNAGLEIEPKCGAMLIWNNAKPDGSPNEGTLHAGTPVLEGTKYVLTKWYRARPWVP